MTTERRSARPAVVFDLDGVLIDSESVWDAVKKQLIEERGGTWKDSAPADMMGMNPNEWPYYMRDELGLTTMSVDQIREHVLDGVKDRYRSQLPLVPGAYDAVARIASQWALGLASSSARSVIELALETSGLKPLFDVVVASEEVKSGKPSPDVYEEACNRLAVSPARAVAVEDSENGILSAKRAGMRVIAIPHSSYPPSRNVLKTADVVLESIQELSTDVVAALLPTGAERGANRATDRARKDISTMAETLIAEDAGKLASQAAELLVTDLAAAIRSNGSATWVIAGGTSPNAAYRIIADRHLEQVDWPNVRILIGDERCVPLTNPDSNWHVASGLLLDRLRDLGCQLLRPHSDLTAEEAATDYAAMLGGLPQADGLPVLDVVWLGMGEDGHTLSLFPGRDAELFSDSLVIPVHNSPKPPPDRISLTLKALRCCARGLILAAGRGKAKVIQSAQEDGSNLPVAEAARSIESGGGRVTWLLDKAAAGQ
jgi:6-phosphogluconolactonase